MHTIACATTNLLWVVSGVRCAKYFQSVLEHIHKLFTHTRLVATCVRTLENSPRKLLILKFEMFVSYTHTHNTACWAHAAPCNGAMYTIVCGATNLLWVVSGIRYAMYFPSVLEHTNCLHAHGWLQHACGNLKTSHAYF